MLIFFHESYHVITIPWEVEGICFGKCAINEQGFNDTWASSAIYWNDSGSNYVLDYHANEVHAWWFSIGLTYFILIGMVYSLNKLKVIN